MKKLILYIAISLDGYIADKNGGVSWLEGDGSDIDNIGSYSDFYSTIDTVILGYKTYNQIVTDLSPERWVYSDKKSYVITHRDIEDTPEVTFTTSNLTDLLCKIRSENGGNIWLCGGATLVKQAMAQGLIDEYVISIIPTILGGGTPLFNDATRQDLTLLSTKSYNGIVDLRYGRRK